MGQVARVVVVVHVPVAQTVHVPLVALDEPVEGLAVAALGGLDVGEVDGADARRGHPHAPVMGQGGNRQRRSFGAHGPSWVWTDLPGKG